MDRKFRKPTENERKKYKVFKLTNRLNTNSNQFYVGRIWNKTTVILIKSFHTSSEAHEYLDNNFKKILQDYPHRGNPVYKFPQGIPKEIPNSPQGGGKKSPKAKSPSPKRCPDGKIFNRKTGRCVSINGKVGRALAKAQGGGAKPGKKPKSPKAAKQCPDGKILNPATGRCVSVNGKIGKELAKAQGGGAKPGKKPKSPKAAKPLFPL